jgi:imidazoleglycerol-phosphate dehydratase
VNVPYGENLHHIIEAVFKAVGRAMDAATEVDAR